MINDRGKFVAYRQTSNINRASVGYNIVDHSDVVGAPPVGTAPTHSLLDGNVGCWVEFHPASLS